MSEGEHTIISKIPRERLNQIAGKKLSALGIPVRLSADRETLEGDLAFGIRVANPISRAPIARARFTVEGHDHLRFVDPPLSALTPVIFHDVERSGALETRVAEALARRAAALGEVAAELRALGLEVTFDPDRLVARAVVKSVGHAFELLGGPEGVHVSRIAPVGGRPWEVPITAPQPLLREHASRVDLELWLEAHAEQMRPSAASTGTTAPARTGAPLVSSEPPRNALTLRKLVDAFGEGAAVAPNAQVQIFQEFEHAGTHYRFVATRGEGGAFKGRLIGPGGDVWSDQFELASFPGVHEVVTAALGAAGRPVASEPSSVGLADVPEHLIPHTGEVWVMSVVIEDMGDEVRYVGTDIDGRPYGAARVLKRADFEAVFTAEGGGWRLLILIEGVQDGQVVYRQLDSRRQPLGAPRRMAAGVLVANFVPEAAAY